MIIKLRPERQSPLAIFRQPTVSGIRRCLRLHDENRTEREEPVCVHERRSRWCYNSQGCSGRIEGTWTCLARLFGHYLRQPKEVAPPFRILQEPHLTSPSEMDVVAAQKPTSWRLFGVGPAIDCKHCPFRKSPVCGPDRWDSDHRSTIMRHVRSAA